MVIFDAVFGGILSAVNFVVGGLVAIAGVITTLFLDLAVSILNAVISTGFISLSYTNTTNPFIATGWELTRGLTNIIFVLALLAIGLGTALKINDFQAKKALPLLIIIALLINFSPVLLGLIVDASNIVMNYFLSSGFQGGSLLGNQISQIGNLWAPTAEGFLDPVEQGNKFMGLVVIVFFNVIAAFIFFIFSAIFLMRYVVIWLLVILSPIAFACYILPKTRSVFNQWWKQFIQWTFVGVTAGFFLYLANQLMRLILIDKSVAFTAQGGEGLGFLNSILPWGVIIIFLFLGLQAAMSSSAQGAGMVIGAVKGAPKNFAKTKIGGKLVGGAASIAQRGLTGTSNLPGRLGKIPLVGKPLSWATKPLGWMAKGANKAVGPGLIEYAAQKRKVPSPKGWDQMSVPEKENYINAQTFGSDKLVLASKMKGEGTFQNASKKFKEDRLRDAKSMASNIIYKKEVGDILDAIPDQITKDMKLKLELSGISTTEINPATGLRVIDEVRNKFNANITDTIAELGLVSIPGGPTDEDQAAQILHMRGFKPKDIAEVAKSSLTSESFQLATRKMSSKHLEALQNNFDEKTIRAVLDEGKGLNILDKAQVQGIKTSNLKLHTWAYENPAGKEMLNWSTKFPAPAAAAAAAAAAPAAAAGGGGAAGAGGYTGGAGP